MHIILVSASATGFIANFCVSQLAKFDGVSERATECVLNSFYVDDFLHSLSQSEETQDLVQELIPLFRRGGFRLRSWVSNDDDVMSQIEATERDQSLVNLELDNDNLTTRTLGMKWNLRKDSFCFEVKVNLDVKPTRRVILSNVATVFDPFQLLGPIMLPARLLFQKLCAEKLDWDAPLSVEDEASFVEWLRQLAGISDLEIPRCLKSKDIDSDNIVSIQMHGFADSSSKAYAAETFLVQRDDKDHVDVGFVKGKSRVLPLRPKNQTIPRAECTASACLVDLMERSIEELRLPAHITVEKHYHTDSTAVLACINNTSKRLDVFWANRIGKILLHSIPSQWHFVPTALNPADVGTRPIMPNERDKLNVWLNGPAFLKEPLSCEFSQPVYSEFEIPDVCLATFVDDGPNVHVDEIHILNDIMHRHSVFMKLKRNFAWLARFAKFIRSKGEIDRTPLKPQEYDDAELAICRLVQIESGYFVNGKIEKSLARSNLTPFIHDDGLIRVGGRLDNSRDLVFSEKHPIVLPSNHHVTTMIVRYAHLENAHSPYEHTLSSVRSKFWVTHARAAVKRVLKTCPFCTRHHARPLEQFMAPLPEERISSSYPFQCVGLDYFGNFLIIQGRRRVKRYVNIFVCCTTRAVHLEPVNSLTTDGFLCSMSRFCARRGKPSDVFADNATNLRGAESDIIDIDYDKVTKAAAEKGIEWHWHPPKGSSHAGHYERLIRSVRKALRAVCHEAGETSEMSEDNFTTFLCEAEKVVNDRPLTRVSEDPNDDRPLTPNMILLLRSNSCAAPFQLQDTEVRKHYTISQNFADRFWKRWRTEYMAQLQARQKNLLPQRNLKVDDLVFMTEDKVPRGKWPLARIVEAKPDRDGFVRSVMLQDKKGLKRRPINKLALLEGME